ncbi:MAG: YafY family transcriptional regulator [Phycisphaerae bacterium]|nr:YafY family transcriptional regulator [Phycisphaerae bacterium]
MSVSRIHRLLRLITLLQGGRRYTAADLAGELEVSKRTIFRDLNMLELAGIPYYFDPEKGGYTIRQHFFLPPINLTITEALSMLMLAGRTRGIGRVPLMTHAARAAMKVESALPASIRRHVGSVIDRLSVSPGPVARHSGLDATFDDLTGAIIQRRICRVVYISFHERKQITTNLHPLRLAFVGRAWYLIAYSARHKEVRTFKLPRMRKLTVTKRQFAEPTDLDLDDYFGRAWGMIPEGRIYNVHLHFDRKVAGNVAEVHWHNSQRIEFNDDGSAEMYVEVDGLGEVTWWILGYGDRVEVVAPVALRRRVAAIARSIVKKYQAQGP